MMPVQMHLLTGQIYLTCYFVEQTLNYQSKYIIPHPTILINHFIVANQSF